MTAKPTVLIRADAGLGMGFGHMMRCLALARALTQRGATVTVAARVGDDGVKRRVRDAGAELVVLGDIDPDETANGPAWPESRQRADATALVTRFPQGFDAVVVDHYRLDESWETVWREQGARVVVIDDLASRPHAADVLVDHNWYGSGTARRYADLVSRSTMLLFGPRYALLQPEYAQLRVPTRDSVREVRSIIVNFGGTDVSGQSVLAVAALAQFPQIEVNVVVGTVAAVTPRLTAAIDQHPRARLHVEVPSLAPLLASSDLAIGAGGTGTWERLCMKVPALVTTVSENQSGVTRQFDRDGVVRWLGTAQTVTVDTYVAALRDVVDNGWPELPDVVDGYGAGRVAMAVLNAPHPPTTVVVATDRDAASYVTAGGAGVFDDGGSEIWRTRTALFYDRASQSPPPAVVWATDVPVGIMTPGLSPSLDPYIDESVVAKEQA